MSQIIVRKGLCYNTIVIYIMHFVKEFIHVLIIYVLIIYSCFNYLFFVYSSIILLSIKSSCALDIDIPLKKLLFIVGQ